MQRYMAMQKVYDNAVVAENAEVYDCAKIGEMQ